RETGEAPSLPRALSRAVSFLETYVRLSARHPPTGHEVTGWSMTSSHPHHGDRSPDREKDPELGHHSAIRHPSCSANAGTNVDVGVSPHSSNGEEVDHLEYPHADE